MLRVWVPYTAVTGIRNYNSGYPATTSWAQPSGLSLSSSGNTMYVADSESSSVRSLDLTSGSSNAEAGGDPGFADNLLHLGIRMGKVLLLGSSTLLRYVRQGTRRCTLLILTTTKSRSLIPRQIP